MIDLDAHVIFCEQVREEVSGQHSYIGVYDQNGIEVDAEGMVLPNLTVVATFRIPKDIDIDIPYKLKVIKFANAKEIAGTFTSDLDFSELKIDNNVGFVTVMTMKCIKVSPGDGLGVFIDNGAEVKALAVFRFFGSD